MDVIYEVRVTENALSQMVEIENYITNNFRSERLARKWIVDIDKKLSSLAYFPNRFQIVEEEPWKTKRIRRTTHNNYKIAALNFLSAAFLCPESLREVRMREYYPEEFKEYLLERERSKNTIDSYLRSIKIYFNSFDEVTKENLIRFKQEELEKHKPTTAALRCFAMNVYCDFLNKQKLKIKSVPIYNRNHLENVISVEEYKFFLDCLKRDGVEKLYWILRFMASTGARASEIVKLEKSCLKYGEFTMWTKGKVRRILIPTALIRESKLYFESVDSKYLFPNRYGKQMLTEGISHQLTKYGKRYGIREEVLHPHSFRHLFAVQFLKENNNLTLLSNLLGHESVKTTAIYLSLSTEEQKRQLDETMKW